MSCFACEGVGPGGVIAETSGWIVDHCIGPLGVGTLIVKPKRHVLHVAELTASEAAELGPLLQRVAAAVTELASPEQVYLFDRGETPDETAAVAFAASARELLVTKS